MIISSKTKLNAVIGYPLGHSLSPVLHNIIYQKNGIDAAMLALPHRDIRFLVKIIRDLPIHLAAVTMPHKQSVIKHLDWVDKTARIIGAINLVINRNGKLCGYNTDIAGIDSALKKVKIKGKSVLLLGAGGAARAAAYYAKNRGGCLLCFNRTFQKAKKLAKEFEGKVVNAKDLKNSGIDVIINATPVGMRGISPDCFFPVGLLNGRQIVFDMVYNRNERGNKNSFLISERTRLYRRHNRRYNPVETKLLKSGRLRGARTIPGLEMFVGQALEQVRLWLGQEVSDDNYFDFLKNFINRN